MIHSSHAATHGPVVESAAIHFVVRAVLVHLVIGTPVSAAAAMRTVDTLIGNQIPAAFGDEGADPETCTATIEAIRHRANCIVANLLPTAVASNAF